MTEEEKKQVAPNWEISPEFSGGGVALANGGSAEYYYLIRPHLKKMARRK